MKIEHVHYMPREKEPGVLYISREFEIAIHLCPCGCGEQSVTPIAPPRGWTLTEHDGKVTLSPSILNRICGAHYFIRDNEIVWA